MASLDDDILIEPLEENLADDPYGTWAYAIKNLTHRAIKLDGLMNDHERSIILRVDELIREFDGQI